MFAATRGRGAAVFALRSDNHSDWSPDKSAAVLRSPESPRTARGGYRGRVRRTGGGFNGQWREARVPQPPTKDLFDDLDLDAIQTIKHPSPMDVEEVEIKDVKYHTSYTWMESAMPTIIVPGEPSK